MTGRRLQSAFPYLLYAAISIVFCWPLFERPNGLGISDWDQHLFYYGSVIKNVVEYGQMPFWNPWYCGGNVLWQNPQIAILSPVYPMSAIVSLALAMKVNILLHYWIGFVGMHLLLTRIVRVAFLPLVVFLASVFTLSGALVLHLNAGHSNFLPAFYLPLLLYLFLRSVETGTLGRALIGGAILALTIYNGGLHIVPMALVLVGGSGAVASVVLRRWQPFALAALLITAGFCYSAPKLLPVVNYVNSDRFWDARTVIEHPDLMTSDMILRTYLEGFQSRSMRVDALQRHGWFEYGNYVGSFAAILFIASVVWIAVDSRSRRSPVAMASALISVLLLLLSAGEFSRIAPASIAAHVPLFSSFRIPSRYTVALPLMAALCIGCAVKTLNVDRALAPGARAFLALVFAFATFQLFAQNRVQLSGVFPGDRLNGGFHLLAGPRELAVDRTTSAYGPGSPMFTALANNRAFYNCYESLQLRHTAGADRPLLFVEGDAQLAEARFSPNRVDFAVIVGRQPSRIVLNQNYAEGWTSDAGRLEPDPVSGAPSVMLAPGQAGRFSFRFRPPGLWTGLVVLAVSSALSLLAAGAAGRRRPLPESVTT